MIIKKKGSLFVISAPSGAGKTTLCRRLCETVTNIRHSVSYTTRKPRQEEIDGVHYTFVDDDKFRAMVADSAFVEWASVHGNFYGTSKKRIENMMKTGIDVILDIDAQGARQIRETIADGILIFILPPSMDVLRERLMGRKSDSEEVIEKRLKKAAQEIKEYKNYDYVIVNDLFEDAIKELTAIIIAERAKTSKICYD